MRNPPIPTMPCFACGIMTNETQSMYGIGHHRCFVEYNPARVFFKQKDKIDPQAEKRTSRLPMFFSGGAGEDDE